MALGANERQRSAVPLQDPDGRLIVVGPDGVPIGGGGGTGGADPLSDGTDAGALPTKTLWVAGADGAVLRGLRVDASGRARVVVEGTPAVSVSNFPASQAVTGPLTDAQLRASNIPVSGPLTDTQLRASAVPVSGAFFQGTQPVSGPLTDVQLRASAVPVSGPLTDTQLRASAVPVTDSRLPAALDADGGMKVHVQNPSAGGGGGASQADKSAYTEGTTVFTPMGGVLNETITADPTEDQAAAARITPKRAVHSNLRNNSGAEIGIAAAPVRTDPTGTTTQPVSGTVNIGTAPQVAVNNVETLTDNAGFTDGTSKLFPQGYIFDDVAGTALTENDVAAARINVNRAVATVTEDGVTRGRYATVKAASTPSIATDTGQVVHLHPLSSTPFPLAPGNRTTFSLTGLALAPVTGEALQSLIAVRNLVAAAAATSQTVTAGKTLRIISINISMVTTAAAVLQGFVAFRAVTSAGTLAITSPLLWTSRLSAPGAVASTGMSIASQFPDGIDLPAGAKFGFSFAFSATTGVVDIALEGYEF